MKISERNRGKRWTSAEVKELKRLANENTPTRVIGLKMGRPVDGIYSKASEKGISLDPSNRSPRSPRRHR